jgi:hypothetical protein
MLGWLLYENGIEPHVTVFDKSAHTPGLARSASTACCFQSTQATFVDKTQSKPSQHIRGPVCQPDNPGGNQANAHDHAASRCRLGKHHAAEASAPTCTAWPDGNASHRLPESGTPRQWPRTVSRSGRGWSKIVFRRCGRLDATNVVSRTWSASLNPWRKIGWGMTAGVIVVAAVIGFAILSRYQHNSDPRRAV